MSHLDPPADPVYARLTAPGRGAVATIFVSGANLLAQLRGLFRPISGMDLADDLGSNMIYGRWIAQGQPGEDLIVCPITGTMAEIHCHGGDAAVTAVVRSLEANRFRAATDQEFAAIRQISPWKSDAEKAIQKATTERTSLLLLELLRSIDDEIDALAKLLENEPEIAANKIREILEFRDFGIHLTEPWTVVLSGKPNVGKSSLINAIVGFERAIVHPTAGTTRDVVEQLTGIDGWPVRLMDTAGLRLSADQIEKQGVFKAQQQIKRADLVLLIMDATENERPDAGIFGLEPDACLLVVNKSDLVASRNPGANEIWTSATTGQGIDRLIQEIGIRIAPDLPTESLFPINMRQVATFERVLNLVHSDELATAAEVLRNRSDYSSPPKN